MLLRKMVNWIQLLALSLSALLWLVLAIVYTDESRALLSRRTWPDAGWQEAHKRGKALRVISINCAVGMEKAAAEVEQHKPDIVLLQESPAKKNVQKLASRLFGESGGFVWHGDTSVIARGSVKDLRPDPPLHFFTVARVRLESGVEIDVVSAHLYPPILRTDLWRVSCWRNYMTNSRVRVEELQELVDALPHSTRPMIIGGDFNAPAGDNLYRNMPQGLRDSFKDAGVGWGNTVLNEIPISRFDQVWVSHEFEVAALAARRTKNSDHRMVICDILLPNTKTASP